MVCEQPAAGGDACSVPPGSRQVLRAPGLWASRKRANGELSRSAPETVNPLCAQKHNRYEKRVRVSHQDQAGNHASEATSKEILAGGLADASKPEGFLAGGSPGATSKSEGFHAGGPPGVRSPAPGQAIDLGVQGPPSPSPLLLDHELTGSASAPTLVLLHAGGMSRREWRPFLPAFGEHFRVLAPTALGHGRSPRAPSFTVRMQVDAVLSLLDHLGIEAASFVGSSLGGVTALTLALTHPRRVQQLVLYRSGFRHGSAALDSLRRFATEENWSAWGLKRWMEREHDPQGGPSAWTEVIRAVAAALEPPLAGPPITEEDLAGIGIPVLLIGGDRDPLVPLQELVGMYKAIPNASLWVVPHAGHIMAMESWRRPAFELEVLRFLTRRKAGPESRAHNGQES